MERDVRRDRGQWKGCHSFKNGGLKMGQTYYYYYELDGSTEVHDPSLPSTTACPSLPGQPVNTIYVPFEMSARKRSASLSSVRDCDFMTVKPEHKFVPARVAPPVPEPPLCRQATSHVRSLVHKRSTRSLSPNPSWSWSPRRLFSRSKSSQNQKESVRNDVEPDSQPVEALTENQDERTTFRSPSAQSCRSRDISPDSLLRFLSDNAPLPAVGSAVEDEDLGDGPALAITEDVAEENDDDDNFATSAQSESAPVTVLSPPPSQRSFSSSSSLARLGKQSRPQTPAHPIRSAPSLPALNASRPQSRLSTNSLVAPHSPESTLSQAPSFYFSDDDDEEYEDVEVEDDGFGLRPLQGINTSFGASFGSLLANFSGYTLPEAATSENKTTPTASTVDVAHREVVAPAISIAPIEETCDLADELRWMAPAVSKA